MCPLHADHELRRVDARLLNPRRRIHVRKPKNAKLVETSLKRGFRNNGVVDVLDDDSDDSDSEFYDEETQEESVVYRMPASGIKLDFIDKIKKYVRDPFNCFSYSLLTTLQHTRPASPRRTCP